jgi:hypothetical protein
VTSAVTDAPTRAGGPTLGTPLGVQRPARALTVVGAALVLFACYLLLSAFTDARGTLGTDTGGKLASLEAMDRNGDLDPDLGYWAERWDPRGDLHPLFYTQHLGDRWVNLTTLPMPVLASPLYDLGGARAVLVLPMLGSVLAALAARALARRLARDGEPERAGWWAFWLVGLASPLTIYALDFWEHSLGVAALLWACVLALDLVDERAGWRAALAIGALVGAAATMRTEAFVYGLLLGLGVAVLLVRIRIAAIRIAGLGAAAAGGLAALLLANQLLERVVLGSSLRAGRAAGTAAAGGSGVSRRLDEAVTTLIGVNRFERPLDWVFGALAAIAVAYGSWCIAGRDSSRRALGIAAVAVAATVYVLRFADGLGFVPGLLTASPLAIAGVALAVDERRLQRVALLALATLPIIWIFQYSGGAAPQWGARYLVVSGALLAVVAAMRLARAHTPAVTCVIVLALGVTAAGVAWLGQRSHAVADGMEALVARDDAVLVSREAHLLREGGAFYGPDRQWLTATTARELGAAAAVAEESGADEVAVLAIAGRSRPARIGAYARGATQRIELLPGVDMAVTTYERP